jgi:hypothetical protein
MKPVFSRIGLCSRNGKGLPILPILGVTALVLWGVALWSTVGFSLSPLAISLTYCPPFVYGVIVGLILGDATLLLRKGRKNARLGFKQTTIHSGFILSVFSILSHYIQSGPQLVLQSGFGKGLSIELWTRSYPFLT